MALQDVILEEAGRTEVAAGEVIFNAGDVGRVMYFILSGEVKITVQGQQLDHLTAGAVFGEMALVDNERRSATATAVTDCVLAFIDKECFAALIQRVPTFATEIMNIMARRLRHFMEEEVKRQRLEQELAIGRQIQLSLLPERCPLVPGWDISATYRAARVVGGDLYDVIPDPTDPDLLHLVIADVTGKGVAAAMFMGVCRTIIRSEALNGRSPADLLQRTNQTLRSERRPLPFLTAFFATLNVRTGRLTYAIGGHDRPYWVRASDGCVRQLDGRGMLLGAFPAVHVEEKTLALAPGDALILYTDGITEARRGQELFEEARLEAVIATHAQAPVGELSQAILTAVAQFSGDTPQADDMTLVIVKRR